MIIQICIGLLECKWIRVCFIVVVVIVADHFDFSVAVEAKLMDNQVPVVASEVVEKHSNEILH